MIKYLFLIHFVFFLQGIEKGYSQTGNDSLVQNEMKDSVAIGAADSLGTYEKNSDDSPIPVMDTAILQANSTREVSQRQLNSYLKNPDYAYANDPEYWREEAPRKPGVISKFLFSRAFLWIIFILIIGIVFYGVYQLAKENNFKWMTRKVRKKEVGEVKLKLDEDVDFETAIHKYQQEGNYRFAIRYMYLKLLRTVREKGQIAIRDSSTNADIARALGNHPGADDFRYLATAYEYIYYGDFIPQEELFMKLAKKFEDFQQTISV
jgi:choline dehydrogenase-like flavoprotein